MCRSLESTNGFGAPRGNLQSPVADGSRNRELQEQEGATFRAVFIAGRHLVRALHKAFAWARTARLERHRRGGL